MKYFYFILFFILTNNIFPQMYTTDFRSSFRQNYTITDNWGENYNIFTENVTISKEKNLITNNYILEINQNNRNVYILFNGKKEIDGSLDNYEKILEIYKYNMDFDSDFEYILKTNSVYLDPSGSIDFNYYFIKIVEDKVKKLGSIDRYYKTISMPLLFGAPYSDARVNIISNKEIFVKIVFFRPTDHGFIPIFREYYYDPVNENLYYYNILENARFFDNKYYIGFDGKINLRDKPNLDGKIIKVIGFNEEFNLLDYSKEKMKIDDDYFYWLKIELANNVIGWIYGKYIYGY